MHALGRDKDYWGFSVNHLGATRALQLSLSKICCHLILPIAQLKLYAASSSIPSSEIEDSNLNCGSKIVIIR